MLENYSTSFSDFSDDYSQLVGKYVLHETGSTYSQNRRRRIRVIEKVTKTGFKIEDEESLFYFNGDKKGLNGKMDWGVINTCTLLTEDEAKKISDIWGRNKKIKELREKIRASIETMEYDKLVQIEALL